MSGAPETPDALLKRALLELKDLRAQLKAMKQARTEPIAIVGLGCRFPGGADRPERFWSLLEQGVDAVTEIPAMRWNPDAYYDPDSEVPGKMSTRWGGFVADLDQFDPGFFGLSLREAAAMDPQQRLILEVAWEALEDAGISPKQVAGSQTGVFVGLCSSDFHRCLADPPARGGTGIAPSIVANRLSYFFDWKGPSLVLDTACSSSLVAVDLACESLRAGTVRMALAGGVNVILSPDLTVSFSQAGMMARDGRCKTFDASGDGYVRGEGCGVVLLKRLSDALADGDRIHALIRSSASNQDGRSNGLTAPSAHAQQALIKHVLDKAMVAPSQVSYVEAHGTGTPLGDPIELDALRATYGAPRPEGSWCAISSVKTNLGHLEAAAGIAGLIKATLCLEHEAISPHLHFKRLNPNIDLDGTPFVIPTQLRPWPRGPRPRFAAVSSFGFGGTNAHVLLEEAPELPVPGPEPERPRYLLTLSARSQPALEELARSYARHLEAHSGDTSRDSLRDSLRDICHTASVGRAVFSHRLAVAAGSSAALQVELESFARGERTAAVHAGVRRGDDRRRIAFLFTGQGSQYTGMGKALYETEPTFRRALDRSAELLRPVLDKPLLSILYPAEEGDASIHQTGYSQPALFALAHALVEMWRSWGIEPDVVLGHSVGEYAAACVAGCMTWEDGLRLIAERARLMQDLPKNGAMAVVTADEATVSAAIRPWPDTLAIAAINGPQHVVIAGDQEALALATERLEERFLHVEPLRVSHAFHSPLIEPMLDPLERFASAIAFKAPRIPLISNVTGEALRPGQLPDAGHWRRHARSPVLFQKAMESLHARGYECVLEIGPHDGLCQMAKKHLARGSAIFLASLRRKEENWQTVLDSAAKLYVNGIAPDGARLGHTPGARRVDVPRSPFEKRRCWLEPSELKSMDAPNRK